LFRHLARSGQLGELRRDLEEAVSKEDYEQAASLRDKIKQLEEGLS
jgi:protein-arginine kinase activator protein McsA